MGGNFSVTSANYDPYFMQAYAYPNYYQLTAMQQTNGSGEQQSQTSETTVTSPAFQGTQKQTGSSGTPYIACGLTIAAGSAALIYAAKKGNGEGVLAGFKNIWKGITGKGAEKAVQEAASSTAASVKAATPALSEMKIIKRGNSFVCCIPGKTKTTGSINEINRLLNENKELQKLTGLRFNSGETTITSATFKLKDGGIVNTVTFKGDKIEKILNANGDDITSDFVSNGKLRTNFGSVDDTRFASEIEEYISKIKGGDKEIIFGKDTALSNITYKTTIGDNSAEVFRKTIKDKNPEIKKLTTLQEFGTDSDAVAAYVRKSRESGVNVDSILAKDFLNKKKLPDGFRVAEFTLPNSGSPIKVVDGEAAGITIGGKFYDSTTDKFLAYMEKNEEYVNKAINNALKNRNIPENAVMVRSA